DTGWHTIWSVEYPGGTLTQITTHTSSDGFHQFPEWSPDGNKIAIGTGYLDIFNLSTNTIVHTGIIGDFPRWSPDGKWIMMYHEKTNLYDVEGDSLILISNKTYKSCWSPDGQYLALYEKLAYPEVSDKLEIMDFSSRSIIKEFTVSDIGFKIDWSPDGKWIMLGFDTNDHLLILNYETGKIYTGILDGLDSKWYPTWSSDGTLIAFEAELVGSDRKLEIWAVTAPEFMR
ncbi:MAG: PD40 domain-containing protein, partial [Candidatus Marinimicrobia bacterium]|nr:PD40 domain-containing protein [Candidatus Neomarinimicrobiota bacterium]